MLKDQLHCFQEILQVLWSWSFELRPFQQKNSNPLILTNLTVEFEPCMLNLI
jgi:hypothetical protein